MMYRIVQCLQEGLPLDQNVYEGALWSAVGPLSAASIDQDGMPQAFLILHVETGKLPLLWGL